MKSFTSHPRPAGHLRQPRYRSRSFPPSTGQPFQNPETGSFNITQENTTLDSSRPYSYSQAPAPSYFAFESTSGASVIPPPASSEILPLAFELPLSTVSCDLSSQASTIASFDTISDPQSAESLLNHQTQYIPADNMR